MQDVEDTQAAAEAVRRHFRLALLAGCVITAVSLGVRSTFGLFLTPAAAALGTDRAGFALAIAIQNLVWGVGQPIAGAVADRFGAARVLAAGGVLYAVGVYGMANAHSTAAFYLSGGFVVGLAMAAASFAVVLAAVGKLAPPHRRTWAMGVATAAGSFGQVLLVPLAGRVRDASDWRAALGMLAAVTLVILLAAPMLRRSAAGRGAPTAGDGTPSGTTVAEPAEAADAPEPLAAALRRALHHRSFLLLCAGFFVCGFHVTFIGTHLPAYLADVGLGKAVGTRAIALIGLFNVFGAFGAGMLAGRFARNKLLSLIYGLRAIAIVGLVLLPHTTAVALAFGAVMGVLWLSTVPLTSAIVVGQFGVANAGALFGVVFLSHQIGAFIGVWYGGVLADSTGSYLPVWWLAVGLGVFGAIVHLFVDDRPAPQLLSPLRRRPARLRTGVVTTTAALTVGVGGLAIAGPPPLDATAAAATPYCTLAHDA